MRLKTRIPQFKTITNRHVFLPVGETFLQKLAIKIFSWLNVSYHRETTNQELCGHDDIVIDNENVRNCVYNLISKYKLWCYNKPPKYLLCNTETFKMLLDYYPDVIPPMSMIFMGMKIIHLPWITETILLPDNIDLDITI